MILTRFLYSKDEVELSLMMALLKNDDLRIIYYWAYELYYSGFDIFALLLKIYFDFYYEKQPYLLTYIRKKQRLWKTDGAMHHIAYVLRNMYKLQSTNTVFLVRQYMYNYKGERWDYGAMTDMTNTDAAANTDAAKAKYADFGPTILYKFANKKTTSTEEKFCLALTYRHTDNVWYYLKILLEKDGVDVYAVGKMVGNCLNIAVDEQLLRQDSARQDSARQDSARQDSTLNPSGRHYIIACIVNALYVPAPAPVHVNKHLFVVPKPAHLDQIRALEDEKIPIVYDTLMHKRLVTIDASIGTFVLARWQWPDHTALVKDVWFHWEYYAMGAPLWQKRLTAGGGVLNHVTKQIEFPTEELKEAFYELYGYEFDELPKEVQAMSLNTLLENTF